MVDPDFVHLVAADTKNAAFVLVLEPPYSDDDEHVAHEEKQSVDSNRGDLDVLDAPEHAENEADERLGLERQPHDQGVAQLDEVVLQTESREDCCCSQEEIPVK